MISTIFQLSGALMLGYQIAIRDRKEIESDANLHGGYFKVISNANEIELIKTYSYRVGFVLIIIGYLIPFFEVRWCECLTPLSKAIVTLGISIAIVTVSDFLIKIIANRQYRKKQKSKPDRNNADDEDVPPKF